MWRTAPQAARVRVQLHQAREQLEECVRNQEFQQAAELKEAIICLESERSLLIASLQPASEDVRIEKVCYTVLFTSS